MPVAWGNQRAAKTTAEGGIGTLAVGAPEWGVVVAAGAVQVMVVDNQSNTFPEMSEYLFRKADIPDAVHDDRVKLRGKLFQGIGG